MTLPLNGALGFGDINVELEIATAEELGLGEALARSLATTSANPPASNEQDSVIGVGNFYGAANGLTIGYLVVGGGGGGLNGGGGGGSVLSGLSVLERGKSYPIIVGAGGPAGRNSGKNSIFNYSPIVTNFTAPTSGTFVVPAGVSQLEITIAGAGGGGGGNDSAAGSSGQNGSKVSGTITVTPGDVISISVGGGGNQGASNQGGAPGGSGGSSTVGYGGGNGSAAGPGGASGGGGGGGGATVVTRNGSIVAVAGGGGGGGGGGNSGNASGQGPLGQYISGTRGGNGTPKGGDGGGAGGGGGGATAGAGGQVQGGDQGGYAGTTGTSTVTEGLDLTVNGGASGGGPTGGGANGYASISYVVNAFTAVGGGGGGGGDATGPGVSGSSGGGGGAGNTSLPPSSSPGGAGTAGQGFAGGSGYYNGVPFAMGGGGGASAAGQNGETSDSNGGAGVSSAITGTTVTYGGGGGGYRRGTFADLSKGLGGSGGGGAGTAENPVGTILRAGTAGTNGLGGGGGSNAAGGSGVVIVSYIALIPQMTGGTITSYTNGSGKTVQVHTFTSNGVLTYPVPSISWGLPAGSLGTVPQGANVTTVSVNATSSFGNPVTYTLNGSVPSGVVFDIGSGTFVGKTDNNVARRVWNFSVTATDSVRSQLTSTREFSYSISNPVYTSALITDAGFQGGCTSVHNRTTNLKNACNGLTTCTFNPATYGDPFVGTVKQFVVSMSCTNGTGVYNNVCLGGGSEAGYVNWTFTCTPL